MARPPGGYPGGGEPPQYSGEPDPASVPATQEDLQTLRRWLIVAAIWAVAASAIALIALLDDDGGGGGKASGSLSKVEQRLNDRIDTLEDDIQEANTGDDLSSLEDRLDELQGEVDAASQQQETVEGLQGDITTFEDKLRELENRIGELETSQGQDGGAAPPP